MILILNMKHAVFWFRRDLRVNDNHGFFKALQSAHPVIPLFLFDKNILDKLHDKDDARVEFIRNQLCEMQNTLEKNGSSLVVKYGKPIDAWRELIDQYEIAEVHTNHDYEEYAKERDGEIGEFLLKNDIKFFTYKDQVIFEKDEVLKDDGTPYTVFTPYSKKWKAALQQNPIEHFASEDLLKRCFDTKPLPIPSLEEMGFLSSAITPPSKKIDLAVMKTYNKTRDFPAQSGTTKLSVHLRFGTISIRELAEIALEVNETYLNELIWREFYMMILWQFPYSKNSAFKPQYNAVEWRDDEADFAAWCEGKTGYPMVDAGMRQLNETGYMHNRLRMVTASFLSKHLLIHWRKGERYFARKLLDYEAASNVGGWQWSAGTGADGAPYFRIFNPESQQKKFDPDFEFIKKWVPEYGTDDYTEPIVEHKFARERALKAYKAGLDSTANS